MNRRKFLFSSGALLAVARLPEMTAKADDGEDFWKQVRERFELTDDYVHLAGLLLASHPRSVRKTVARHRDQFDVNPALYVSENRWNHEHAARRSAARYLGAKFEDIALTTSTTMGLGLVYNGIAIRPDQEMLTTDQDYYATHQSLRYQAQRSGAALRMIPLFRKAQSVTSEEIVNRIADELRPNTRVLALTWVHSSTGLKLPVQRIAKVLAEHNAGRPPTDRALLCLDGVHGLGVENVEVDDLGCDIFIAGTHKWLFGPRGTGLIWARPEVQEAVTPTIPTFTPDGTWGGNMTPGGFKSFEHQWALTDAFQLHLELGKARVERRIRALSRQLKAGLAEMDHVTLYTPMDDELSAGVVCFDVDGLTPEEVVSQLERRGVIGSTTPYERSYARLAPGILNTPKEIARTLAVIDELA